MSLSDIGPNLTLLSKPWNWFVVAISLIALLIILHFFFRKSSNQDN